MENAIENEKDDLEASAHEDDHIQSHSPMSKIRKMRSLKYSYDKFSIVFLLDQKLMSSILLKSHLITSLKSKSALKYG